MGEPGAAASGASGCFQGPRDEGGCGVGIDGAEGEARGRALVVEKRLEQRGAVERVAGAGAQRSLGAAQQAAVGIEADAVTDQPKGSVRVRQRRREGGHVPVLRRQRSDGVHRPNR